MLTVEPAKLEERGVYVDRLGYAICVGCAASGRGRGELRWYRDESEACDACGRPVVECAPRVVEGTALVEHVKCKIF